jgi:rhamnulokinase
MPYDILPEIVQPGTVIGNLREEVAEETGAGSIPVVAPACHDTGSAVAAVPAESENTAYLSSGTWSLMGIEVGEPVITPESLRYNFTNEGGVGDTFRFLKNIMGLWLVQECRRQWEREGESLDYDELTRMAEEAEPFRSLVEPDDPSFLHPGDMPARIREFCGKTGQSEPETKGQFVRCGLESLALKYRLTFQRLEEVKGRRLEVLHIVGGGCQNRLLNQLTASAIGRPVVAGPVEATAIGNILMQAMARGHLGSVAELRQLVRDSFETERFEPKDSDRWDEAYERYLRMGGE